MGKKWWRGFLWLFLVLIGCARAPVTSGQPGTTGKAPLAPPSLPVITQFFASPKLRPGQTWRVYLIASDRDGEMQNIVCTIDQPGVGTYPVSIIRIDFDKRKELNGYIYLATSTFERLHNVSLTLTVQIQDMAGRYSKPVEFPLSLNDLYQQEPPPPGTFQENDLGPIMIVVHGLRGEGMEPSPFFRRLR